MFTNLNELKSTVRIEDVVSKFVKLKKESGGYIGLCPFHNEKTPSFHVKSKDNFFKCFGCGKSGNAIDFICLKENLSFVDSVLEVAKIINFNMEYDSKEIIKPLHRVEKLSKEFLDNFENVRKISNNTLLQFNVTEALEWMPKAKKEIKVICFNYMRDGELINIKFRGKNKDMKMSKSAELIFYNIDAIRDTEEAVVVEGECFHPKVEVLTKLGWVRFDEWDGENIAQYNEEGEVEFVKPIAKVKKNYNGELLELSNEQKFYSLTTPNHNFVLENNDGDIKKTKAIDIPNGGKYSIPRVALHSGSGIELSDLQIRLCIAVSADFTIRKTGDIYGAFKKERKARRITEILEGLNIPFSMNKDCRDYYSVFIRNSNAPKYLFKLFPHEWIYKSTLSQKRLIIDEILHWDGNSVPNRKQIEYSSKEISNCTFIQTISTLCGYCSTIIPRSNKIGNWFKVSILFSKKYTSLQGLLKKSKSIPYDGIVYCATVPSGMLIVRQNNCISISGNCDCLSMHEAGVYNSVSVPNGANSTKCIDNCYEYFLNKKKIIIATDNDDAGRKLRDELMFRFGVDRCYYVEFPEDCKDANDVLVKYGKEELKKIVDNAVQIPIEGLVSDKERRDRMFDLYENGMPKGTPCGIYGFDDYLRFQGGLVTTITAPPSTGKSEFLDYVVSGLAIKEQWRFGVFSFENQPIELHDAKWAEKIVGKAFGFRKDENNRISKKSLEMVADEIFDKFKVIETSKIDKSVDGVLAKAEELVNKYGIKGLVIDPYNKMLHNIPTGMTETNYINLFMTKVTDFAKKYNIHVFLVVHPTKPQVTNGEQQKRVTLYSASGSANFYNQTDNGFTLMRNRDTGIVEVFIEKVRFSEQGKEGWVSFTFNTLTRQYKFESSKDPILNENQPSITQSIINYGEVGADEFGNTYNEDSIAPPF